MSKNERAISPKTAVIFMDGDLMKVVFGRTVKELYADRVLEDQPFFERLFKDYRVVVVEKASEVTLPQIVGMDEGKSSGPVAHDKPVEKAPEQAAKTAKKEPAQAGMWIKSTSRTTIIIDDLPTGIEIAPGVPMTFSVPHDRAVSMANLDPETVQKSNILKRLLANGTLAWVTGSEAQQMEAEYVVKVAQENDDRLSHWSPIIDGSVDDYLSNPGARMLPKDGPSDAPETVEVSATEVSEMEEMAAMVPESKPRPERTAPVLPNALAGNVSMHDLMGEISKAEQGEGIRPPVERRKITNTEVIPGAKPRGISRR